MIILDRTQIEELMDLQQMMDQIEEAYRIFGKGEFYMPPRPSVEQDNKTMLYMPCYTKEVIGTKILSIFPDNASLGLPLTGLCISMIIKQGNHWRSWMGRQ